MRVKRTGAVAMADTLSSHLNKGIATTSTQFCQGKVALVSCSETATVRFRFTGNNSARQPTLFGFLILLERCADVYARAGKCSLVKRFSVPCRLQSRKCCFRRFDSKDESIIMCGVLV